MYISTITLTILTDMVLIFCKAISKFLGRFLTIFWKVPSFSQEKKENGFSIQKQ